MLNDLIDEAVDLIVDEDVNDMERESIDCCSDDRDIDLVSDLSDEEVESIEFDDGEDISLFNDNEVEYNSIDVPYDSEDIEAAEKEILDSDVESLELEEDY